MYESKAIGKEKFEESSVTSIDDAESILATLYCHTWPGFTVDDDNVAKVFRLPLGMYRGIIAGGIHEDGAIVEKASIKDDQWMVEFATVRESERSLNMVVTDYIGSNQASKKVDSSQPHGMIMVPKIPRVLVIVIVICLVGPRGSFLLEAISKP